jgi:hypothetical protein
MALNLNTQHIIQSFGTSGYGPNDITSPNFIFSINNLDVLLQDGFAKRFNKVDVNKQTNQFEIKKYMDYSDRIFQSGETNISENFIAGRKVGNGKMFYIYDRNYDVVIDVDYFPVIKNLNRNIDFNYIYAPSIALNAEKNRVFAGMYFYDMFHLYDLSGNRIITCRFSKNCIPSFDSNDLMENILQKCNVGIIRSFPTKDYCYFLRIRRDRVENMLVQINWDGELVNVYNIPDEVLGQFYVDEKEKKLYIVRHNLVPEFHISEVFEIVSYSLSTTG